MKILKFIFDTKYKKDIRNCISWLINYVEILKINYQVSLYSEEQYYKKFTEAYDKIFYYRDILGEFEK